MKKWLLFRITHNSVYYLFQGECVILIYLPEGIKPEAYYWAHTIRSKNIKIEESKELEVLQEVIDLFIGNRFTFKLETRPGITYEAINVGTFEPPVT